MKNFLKSIIITLIAIFLINIIFVKIGSTLLINMLKKHIDTQIEQEFNKQAGEILKKKIIEQINESI
jgi:hypothetical protein